MHHKSSDEFHAGNGYGFPFIRFVIFGTKGHFVFGNTYDSCVCDCNAVGIPTKVFDCISVAVESFLYFSIPCGGIELVFELLPGITIMKFPAGF